MVIATTVIATTIGLGQIAEAQPSEFQQELSCPGTKIVLSAPAAGKRSEPYFRSARLDIENKGEYGGGPMGEDPGDLKDLPDLPGLSKDEVTQSYIVGNDAGMAAILYIPVKVLGKAARGVTIRVATGMWYGAGVGSTQNAVCDSKLLTGKNGK